MKMGRLGNILKKAGCLHDCTYHGTVNTRDLIQESEAWCDDCMTHLFTRYTNLATLESRLICSDIVYELLYTRKGRLQLVTEYLEELRVDIPKIWRKDDG